MAKKKPKSIKITYKAVGTPEENQKKLERAFDILFSEVIKRRAIKK